ncbi:ATP-binding cassette domain-containing protein [Halobacillus sp. BAB-2008]|uniref:ABC transporter ATP-binding protein n=1 Tax=Halobacillus sp. BAB-2008 TaxID=1246484 RepID=UPI0002A521B9|nr:ATP-binding cassette domain-containing protein [Halobacillus sp. BAB-2008]ELK44278.1 ABC transporter ATP-binding protein [Halobacillus sp. BAB-2008]
MSNPYVLETQGLTRRYKRIPVVDQVDLQIKEGEIYGFLGPNGAGKTTTIRMLLGLINSSQGDIHFFGKPLKGNRLDILKKVGSLVESPSYYPHLTGFQNLEIMRQMLDVPKTHVKEVLKMVRLTKVADKKAGQYSLGMKQRLAIASAMLGFPKFVILDEPTNGLDLAGIQEIRELIVDLPAKYGMTVMISSHLLSEIDQIATQVGIIAKGKLIFQDSIEQLRAKSDAKILLETNDPVHTREIVESEGVKVRKEGHGVLINHMPDPQVASLISRLVQKEIDVYRVAEQKTSLEDIFLQMTKGGETL